MEQPVQVDGRSGRISFWRVGRYDTGAPQAGHADSFATDGIVTPSILVLSIILQLMCQEYSYVNHKWNINTEWVLQCRNTVISKPSSCIVACIVAMHAALEAAARFPAINQGPAGSGALAASVCCTDPCSLFGIRLAHSGLLCADEGLSLR